MRARLTSARIEPSYGKSAHPTDHMDRFIREPSDAPAAPGAYALLIEIAAPLSVSAGKSRADLAPGRYLYCGSAKGPGGLRARLGRHMRRGKKIHWHVDQLTERGNVLGAWIAASGDECALIERLWRLPAPVDGFGSTDCRRCRSHLKYWPADRRLDTAADGPSEMIGKSPFRAL